MQASSPPEILVGLFSASAATFTCRGPWSFSGPGFENTKIPPGADLTIRWSATGGAWEVSGGGGAASKGQAGPGNLLLSADAPDGGAFISVKAQEGATASFKGSSFRGSIIVMADGGRMAVANALGFEEYVQSVVGGEMPDGWPLESNRAQAIAARSYAAYKMKITPGQCRKDYAKDFRALGCGDVQIWASSTDQVYRGVSEETAVTISATEATRGQVLTYGGAPVAAYFHSDAGGATENPRYVWGGSFPYLCSVKEEPHDSPYSSWTVDLSPEQVKGALRQLGVLAEWQPEAIVGVSAGESGRWFSVAARCASEKATVKVTDIRRVLPQVKSAMFSAYAVGGGKATSGSLSAGMRFSAVSSRCTTGGIELARAAVVGRSGDVVRPAQGAAVISGLLPQRPAVIVLQGTGWGHGVGLSQWGARGMALRGGDARGILLFYYPGTTLEQWW